MVSNPNETDNTREMHGDESENEKNQDKNQEKEVFVMSESTSGSCAEEASLNQTKRRRLISTVFIFCALIMLGWTDGLKGATLPDLQLILGVDLTTASWLFTANSAGNLLGAIAQFYFLSRYRNETLIMVSLIVLAGSNAALPWCSMFPAMVVMMAVMGVSAVVLSASGNGEVVSLWGKKSSSSIHALNLCHSVGTIVSPLAAEPFMAKKICVPMTTNWDNTTLRTNSTNVLYTADVLETNVSVNPAEINISLGDNNVMSAECDIKYASTFIYVVYIITAILTMSTALPFVASAVCSFRKKKGSDKSKLKGNAKSNSKFSKTFAKLSPTLQNVFLLILGIVAAINTCIELCYTGYLMTFVISQLSWGKTSGAAVTSLSWGTFACGRFVGIFLGHYFRSATILFSFGALRICGFTLLLISTYLNADDSLFWISFGISGFAGSLLFPAIFAWCNERLTIVTSRVLAFIFIFISICSMSFLYLYGLMIEIGSPVWYVYLLTAMSVVWLLLFFVLVIMSRVYLPIERGVYELREDQTKELVKPI